MQIVQLNCCGMAELAGINPDSTFTWPKGQILQDLINHVAYAKSVDVNQYRDGGPPPIYRMGCAMIIFSQACNPQFPDEQIKGMYGEKLARYIEENNYGTVQRCQGAVNPNSGNKIYPFIWTLNMQTMTALATKLHKEAGVRIAA